MEKLTWIDRLLIKVAVAKAAARGRSDAEYLASHLVAAFSLINEAA